MKQDETSTLRQTAQKFIENNRAGALATVDANGVPHIAIVYCVMHTDMSIYFSTRVEARKYENLQQNPTVALTFFNEPKMTTIQLTGTASRVEILADEQDLLYELMMTRHTQANWAVPPMKLFESNASNELAVVRVVPTEMTYANFETAKSGRYKPFFTKIV